MEDISKSEASFPPKPQYHLIRFTHSLKIDTTLAKSKYKMTRKSLNSAWIAQLNIL